MPQRYRQLRVNDLPKVPTCRDCRLEWDSNLRPFGRKGPNLPLSHRALQVVLPSIESRSSRLDSETDPLQLPSEGALWLNRMPLWFSTEAPNAYSDDLTSPMSFLSRSSVVVL